MGENSEITSKSYLSLFTLETDKSQTNEILLKQIAALTLENNKKDAIAKNLMNQVAEINLKIMKLEGAK